MKSPDSPAFAWPILDSDHFVLIMDLVSSHSVERNFYTVCKKGVLRFSMADSIQVATMADERAQRIVASEVAHMSSWMESMQEQFGPSSGIHIATFGNAVALVAQELHDNSIFNRVIGLTTQDEKYLKDILAFYATYGVPYRIDLSPYQAHPALLTALARHGLYQYRFQTALYGIPSPTLHSLPSSITVRKVHSSELDLFSDLTAQGYLGVYEGSASNTQRVAESMKGLYGRPGWHLYLACVDHIPAGTALLHVQDQTASFVAATSIPPFRGRGCQTALLRQRIIDAVQEGCTLLVSQTGVGTGSQRNMERVGMHIAYSKALWKTAEKNM